MISKRAFARRIASIHIASNIDYTKVDAIGFSEDNLADEMASILYNLVTQTPLWRKSEKILVDQFLSRGADALLPKGRARRINRKTNLINRLMTQINNSDIVRVLDRQFDADEVAELAKSTELKSLVAPYVDPNEMLKERVFGGNSAYSRASSFLKENVLPSVARRYFPQYLVSRLGEIAQTQEGFRDSTRKRNFSVSLRERVDYYFSQKPKISEIVSEVKSLSRQAFLDGGFRQEIFEGVFSSPLKTKNIKPILDRIKAKISRLPEDLVDDHLEDIPLDYFDDDFNVSDEETRSTLQDSSRVYLGQMRDSLERVSEDEMSALADKAFERVSDRWKELKRLSRRFDSDRLKRLYQKYVEKSLRGSFLDFLMLTFTKSLGRDMSQREKGLVSEEFKSLLRFEADSEADWLENIDVEDLF
jgi:hypothetical protein